MERPKALTGLEDIVWQINDVTEIDARLRASKIWPTACLARLAQQQEDAARAKAKSGHGSSGKSSVGGASSSSSPGADADAWPIHVDSLLAENASKRGDYADHISMLLAQHERYRAVLIDPFAVAPDSAFAPSSSPASPTSTVGSAFGGDGGGGGGGGSSPGNVPDDDTASTVSQFDPSVAQIIHRSLGMPVFGVGKLPMIVSIEAVRRLLTAYTLLRGPTKRARKFAPSALHLPPAIVRVAGAILNVFVRADPAYTAPAPSARAPAGAPRAFDSGGGGGGSSSMGGGAAAAGAASGAAGAVEDAEIHPARGSQAEDQAFFVFTTLMDLWQPYMADGRALLHDEFLVLADRIASDLPQLAAHFNLHGFDVADLVGAVSTWFSSLLADDYTIYAVLRAIDTVLVSGPSAMLSVMFGALSHFEERVMRCEGDQLIFAELENIPLRLERPGHVNEVFIKASALLRPNPLGFVQARATKSWLRVASLPGRISFLAGVGDLAHAQLQEQEAKKSCAWDALHTFLETREMGQVDMIGVVGGDDVGLQQIVLHNQTLQQQLEDARSQIRLLQSELDTEKAQAAAQRQAVADMDPHGFGPGGVNAGLPIGGSMRAPAGGASGGGSSGVASSLFQMIRGRTSSPGRHGPSRVQSGTAGPFGGVRTSGEITRLTSTSVGGGGASPFLQRAARASYDASSAVQVPVRYDTFDIFYQDSMRRLAFPCFMMQGWLLKEGKQGTLFGNRQEGWDRRWFILTGHVLTYLKNKTDPRPRKDRALDLRGMRVRPVENHVKGKLAFELTRFDKIPQDPTHVPNFRPRDLRGKSAPVGEPYRYMLFALSSQERDAWIAALEAGSGQNDQQQQQ